MASGVCATMLLRRRRRIACCRLGRPSTMQLGRQAELVGRWAWRYHSLAAHCVAGVFGPQDAVDFAQREMETKGNSVKQVGGSAAAATTLWDLGSCCSAARACSGLGCERKCHCAARLQPDPATDAQPASVHSCHDSASVSAPSSLHHTPTDLQPADPRGDPGAQVQGQLHRAAAAL